jgi:hypothetical protein
VVGLQRVLWSKEFLALITTISASTTHFGLSICSTPSLMRSKIVCPRCEDIVFIARVSVFDAEVVSKQLEHRQPCPGPFVGYLITARRFF